MDPRTQKPKDANQKTMPNPGLGAEIGQDAPKREDVAKGEGLPNSFCSKLKVPGVEGTKGA